MAESCAICGAPVQVHYGPDIRFNPPCSKPLMYRSECSADDCPASTFTRFTREQALESWDNRQREMRGAASAPEVDRMGRTE